MPRDHATDQTRLSPPPAEELGLAVLLRAWRARAGHRLGRGRPLPQVEVAAEVGMSERWYRDLERGATPRLDARTLTALAGALRLCADERATLFLFAAGGEPFPAVSPADGADLTPLRRLLDLQPAQPAYLTDNAVSLCGFLQQSMAGVAAAGAALLHADLAWATVAAALGAAAWLLTRIAVATPVPGEGK
jgi:transcriptional regulator with XRE-family HTH domain